MTGLESYIKARKRVSSKHFEIVTEKKKNWLHCASVFDPSLGVWISDKTLFLVFDILREIFVALVSINHYTLKIRNDGEIYARKNYMRKFHQFLCNARVRCLVALLKLFRDYFILSIWILSGKSCCLPRLYRP